MTMTKFDDLGFTTDYGASIASQGATSAFPLYEFEWRRQQPSPDELSFETPRGDELVVDVFPLNGDPWQGKFLCGEGGVTGLFGTPCHDVLCVVANGQGYWVPVCDPQRFEEVLCVPVKHVLAVPERSLIAFGSFTELVAYGSAGWRWRTSRLSWDGLTSLDVSADRVTGMAWDAPNDKEVTFSVNVENGQHEGGSSPEAYTQ